MSGGDEENGGKHPIPQSEGVDLPGKEVSAFRASGKMRHEDLDASKN